MKKEIKEQKLMSRSYATEWRMLKYSMDLHGTGILPWERCRCDETIRLAQIAALRSPLKTPLSKNAQVNNEQSDETVRDRSRLGLPTRLSQRSQRSHAESRPIIASERTTPSFYSETFLKLATVSLCSDFGFLRRTDPCARLGADENRAVRVQGADCQSKR